MGPARKYALMISAVVLFLMMIYWLYSVVDQNLIVSGNDIKDYSQKYENNYRNLTETYIHPDNRTYLKFYKESPYKIRAIISTSHGAGVDFIPSRRGSWDLETTNKAIENYIFNGSAGDYKIFPDKFDYRNASILRYTGNGTAFIMDLNTGIDSVAIEIDERGKFMHVLENGSALIQNVLIGKMYYNYIIIKGSNRKKDWTEDMAYEDAKNNFENDLISAYPMSEEFRRYLAMPLLSNIANKMLDRSSEGYYTDYLLFQKDFDELYKIADKYNVSHVFADGIYKFNEDQRKIPSWLERQIGSGIIYQLLIGLLLALLIYIYSIKCAGSFC